MEFKTAYNRGETEYAPLGSETAPVYEYRIDEKTGKRIMVQVGETNLYEKIQASLEGSKLENIIKRATNGDPSVLNQREGQYIDISEMPTNMIDMQNMILRANGEFEKLPAETRKQFENSIEKYISMYGSEEWSKIMGLYQEPVAEEASEKKSTKKKEVKEDPANE